MITCKAATIDKNIYPGTVLKAIPSKKPLTDPIEKNIRYTLNPQTFPGNTFPIIAPLFVCRNVYAPPQKIAHTKERGNDLL